MFGFSSLNSCSFIGNTGKAPESKTFGEGDKATEFVNFSVAVKQYNKADPKKPLTMWVNVQTHGDKLNKLVKDYVLKGSLVAVRGELNVRQYESNGKNGVSIDLRADDVVVLGGKKDGEQAPSNTSSAPRPAGNAPAPLDNPEDDIPF